jgi:hypothetical protein
MSKTSARWGVATAAVLLLTTTTPALAGVGRERAAAIAKRAASARVEQFGMTYPASQWRAACSRTAGPRWSCQVGTGGQCSGLVVVGGTSVRPRVRSVEVSCFD